MKKNCWVTKMRTLLFSLGFGDAWLQQGVGSENAFIRQFKQRLIDNFQQEWETSVGNKDMYFNYRQFKSLYSMCQKTILNM